MDINIFEKIFNIIYIEPYYFKYLELNFNHGIDILLSIYPQTSPEDRQETINYILGLFRRYANE